MNGLATSGYVNTTSGSLSQRLSLTGTALISLIGAASAGVSSINGASGVMTLNGAGNVSIGTVGQTITVTGNTGEYANFYKTYNPNKFVTSGNLESTGTLLQNQVNLITNGTGSFYPKSNPNQFTTSGDVSTRLKGLATSGIYSDKSFIKHNDYVSYNPFMAHKIFMPEVQGILYKANERGTVWYSGWQAYTTIDALFNGDYEYAVLRMSSGSTGVININLSGKDYRSNWVTYSDGYIYMTFYGSNTPDYISGHIKNKNGATYVLANLSGVSSAGASNGSGVCRLQVPSSNYLTEIELTTYSRTDTLCWLTEIDYQPNRLYPVETPIAMLSKGVDSTMYADLDFKDANNAATIQLERTVGNIKISGYGYFYSGLFISGQPVSTGAYLKSNPNHFISSGEVFARKTVSGFSITGGIGRTGALNILAGSNITLTEQGTNTVSIAAAGGGGSANLTGLISTGSADLRYLASGASGQFYLKSNPDHFSSSGNVQNTGSTLYSYLTNYSGDVANFRYPPLIRTLYTTANQYTQIGNFVIGAGGHNLGVFITISDGGISLSKSYEITSQYNDPLNQWQELIPTADSGPYGGNDFALDISGLTSSQDLRIRRTAGSNQGDANIQIINYGKTTDAFTPSSNTGIDTASVVRSFNTAQLTFPSISGNIQSTGTALQNQINSIKNGTGNFYLKSNPDKFSSSGNVENTGTSLQNRINSLSGYVNNDYCLLLNNNGIQSKFNPATDSNLNRGNAIFAAQTAANSGNLIYVNNGEAYLTGSLGKHGVNWFFMPGSKLLTNESEVSLWDDNNIPMSFGIGGLADFVGGPSCSVPTINFENTGTNIIFNCQSLRNFNPEVIVPTIYVEGSKLKLNVLDDIYSESYDAIWINSVGKTGSVYIDCPIISGGDNAVETNGTLNLIINSHRLMGGVGESIQANGGNIYIQTNEILSSNPDQNISISLINSTAPLDFVCEARKISGVCNYLGGTARIIDSYFDSAIKVASTGLTLQNCKIRVSGGNSVSATTPMPLFVLGTLSCNQLLSENIIVSGGMIDFNNTIILQNVSGFSGNFINLTFNSNRVLTTLDSGNFVNRTNNQTINGIKTFNSDINANNLIGAVGGMKVDLNNGLLIDTILPGTAIDWYNRKLNNQDENLTLDWLNRQLTGGIWYAEGLRISGQAVIPGAGSSTNINGLISTGDADLRYVKTGDYLKPTQNYTGSNNLNKIVVNWASGNVFKYTLTGNSNVLFTGHNDGQTVVVTLANTGINYYSGIWPSMVHWSYDVTPVQSSGNKADVYTFIRVGSGIYGSVVQGFNNYNF